MNKNLKKGTIILLSVSMLASSIPVFAQSKNTKALPEINDCVNFKEENYNSSLANSILEKNFDEDLLTDEESKLLDYLVSKETKSTEEKEEILEVLKTFNDPYLRSVKKVISVDKAGKALNIVIDLALLATGEGGLANAGIKKLEKKYGVEKAKEIIEKKVVTKVAKKLSDWGLKGMLAHAGRFAGIIIDNIFDPGTAIAKFIDNHLDANKGNGYLDVNVPW